MARQTASPFDFDKPKKVSGGPERYTMDDVDREKYRKIKRIGHNWKEASKRETEAAAHQTSTGAAATHAVAGIAMALGNYISKKHGHKKEKMEAFKKEQEGKRADFNAAVAEHRKKAEDREDQMFELKKGGMLQDQEYKRNKDRREDANLALNRTKADRDYNLGVRKLGVSERQANAAIEAHKSKAAHYKTQERVQNSYNKAIQGKFENPLDEAEYNENPDKYKGKLGTKVVKGKGGVKVHKVVINRDKVEGQHSDQKERNMNKILKNQ